MVDVPLGYTQRDQLLGFMESKFPGAQISIAHCEGSKPTIAEVLVGTIQRLSRENGIDGRKP